MSKIISVRLDKSRHEKLTFLYKLYLIQTEKDSDRFRELLDKLYSEKLNPSDSTTLSTNQHPDLELLDGWECNYRSLIWPHNKYTKKKEPKIICTHPMTREILRTNELYIATCKKCNDSGGSVNLPSLPAPKKPLDKEKAEFLDKARKQRKCVDCGEDITGLEKWKTRCISCWRKSQNPAWQSDTKPLRGSPMDLRMRESDRIKKANEQLTEE